MKERIKMFEKFKETVKELAHTAVLKAEDALGSKTGQMKKEMALNYIIKNLPLPSFLKPLIVKLISGFIDDAIEFAVDYMKKHNCEEPQSGEKNDEL